MAQVRIWGNLAHFTGGINEIELQATTIKQVLDQLGERFPALAPELEENVSVSVDGEIFASALFAPVKEDSEVVLLPRLKGG